LFTLASKPKLMDWLNDTAEEVTLSCAPSIQIWLKKGKTTEWMKGWNRGIETSEVREWMHDVGLTKLKTKPKGIMFDTEYSDFDYEA
jgi:hypothetical protein